MGYDKIVDSSQLDSDLKDIGDAIRAKTGNENQLTFPSGFVSEIGNIGSDWVWMGANVEHLAELDFEEEFTLADTDFPDWTPSETAATIRNSQPSTTFQADMANYAYTILSLVRADFQYLPDTPMSRTMDMYGGLCGCSIGRRPSSTNDCENYNYTSGVVRITIPSAHLQHKYSLSGLESTSFSSYGLYISAPTHTVNSPASNTSIITVSSPPIAMRCNNSYLSVDAAKRIDAEKTIIKHRAEIYRTDILKNPVVGSYKKLLDIYNSKRI